MLVEVTLKPNVLSSEECVYIIEWLVLQAMYVLNKELLQFLSLKSKVYKKERFQIKSVDSIFSPRPVRFEMGMKRVRNG